MNWATELRQMYEKHYVNLDHKDALEIAEELETIPLLKTTVNKIITGVWVLFIALTIGIISKYVFPQWQWLTYVPEITIIAFTIGIDVIRNKMKKKQKEQQKEAD